jgi:hypothetical protein
MIPDCPASRHRRQPPGTSDLRRGWPATLLVTPAALFTAQRSGRSIACLRIERSYFPPLSLTPLTEQMQADLLKQLCL